MNKPLPEPMRDRRTNRLAISTSSAHRQRRTDAHEDGVARKQNLRRQSSLALSPSSRAVLMAGAQPHRPIWPGTAGQPHPLPAHSPGSPSKVNSGPAQELAKQTHCIITIATATDAPHSVCVGVGWAWGLTPCHSIPLLHSHGPRGLILEWQCEWRDVPSW